MTRIEQLRQLINLPVEDLATYIVEQGSNPEEWGDTYGLYDLWYDRCCMQDPLTSYCCDHHHDCDYLEDPYYEGEGYYQETCTCKGVCPYGVDRHEVAKQMVIQDLTEELEDF